jgi:peptide/nickel transport system ATP-binding protein
MRELLLETKGLKTFFPTKRGMLHAVDDINIRIHKGETLGVVGESGCGKTTLGRTILRLQEPIDGEILYRGEDIRKYNASKMKEMRRKMQIIFQDPYSSLNPRQTVAQAIAAPLVLQGIVRKGDKEGLEKKVLEMMDRVGLARRFVNTYPHELDGGRRQRIGIARALALDPEFIVCDEPVSALDVSIQAQILNLMQDLQEEKGLTYMFITHDLSVVKHISNNILVMYLGQLVETCESDELFEHTLHPYTKALLSAIPTTDIDNRKQRILMQGELSSPINPAPGCRFAPRCRYAEERCKMENPVIEEVLPGHFVACHRVREINDMQ